MSAADQKLHREILIRIYEAQRESLRGSMVNVPSLVEDFVDVDRDEFRYHIDRLKDDRLVEHSAQYHVKITIDGVEKLAHEGYETFLEFGIQGSNPAASNASARVPNSR